MKKISLFAILLIISSQSFAAPAKKTVFSSEQECREKTGKSCNFQMCDYIPEGKTFEEVCGKGFRKGWVASARN